MTTITTKDIKKLAHLVRMELTAEEIAKLSGMFSETLEKIEVLKELDTQNTPETYQVTGLANVFQEAACGNATLVKEDALANASDRVKDSFATKAVFNR